MRPRRAGLLIGSAVAVGVVVLVGSPLGALAGWFGGFVDSVVMRLIDVVLSIPGFLLAITLVVLLGFGIFQAAIAVGLTSSATFARLIRSEVLRARASTYVEVSITSGASTYDILRRHVVPNSLAPTLSLITVQLWHRDHLDRLAEPSSGWAPRRRTPSGGGWSPRGAPAIATRAAGRPCGPAS